MPYSCLFQQPFYPLKRLRVIWIAHSDIPYGRLFEDAFIMGKSVKARFAVIRPKSALSDAAKRQIRHRDMHERIVNAAAETNAL